MIFSSVPRIIPRVFFILILVGLFFYFSAFASDKKDGIENFPDTFQPYLIELSKKHPSWNFRALYTNLDWNYVIDQENIYGKNLVPKNYSDSWTRTI